jgi:hypothetical protein
MREDLKSAAKFLEQNTKVSEKMKQLRRELKDFGRRLKVVEKKEKLQDGKVQRGGRSWRKKTTILGTNGVNLGVEENNGGGEKNNNGCEEEEVIKKKEEWRIREKEMASVKNNQERSGLGRRGKVVQIVNASRETQIK